MELIVPPAASMNDVRKYLEYPTVGAFRTDWATLTDQDKTDLKSGVGNGSYTY